MQVRIPKTGARRQEIIFAKLLYCVADNVDGSRSGFDFRGVFLKPGSYVDESRLWPGPGYPKEPILVECAGSTGKASDGSKGRQGHPSECLYVLWRYRAGGWSELARAQSDTWIWALDLAPIAARAIREQGTAEVLPSLEAVTLRIGRLITQELASLESGDRGRVLAILHDQFACRMAALL